MISIKTFSPVSLTMATSILFISCIWLAPLSASAASIENLKTKRTRIMSEIKRLNDDLVCSTSEDCEVIAIGARSCGGPSSFVIASKKNDKLPAIARKAKEITKVDTEINQVESMMGTCEVRMPPPVTCKNLLCREGADTADSAISKAATSTAPDKAATSAVANQPTSALGPAPSPSPDVTPPAAH